MKRNKQKIDWDNLGFNPLPTRSMWKGDCSAGDEWVDGQLIPYGEISLITCFLCIELWSRNF